MTDDRRNRLGTSVAPSAYRLSFEPDLAGATFTGTAEIEVDVDADTASIELNAVELELTDVVAELPDGSTVTADASLDAELERAALRFERPLPAGRVVLRVRFAGVLNDRLVGFYRSTFTDAAGHDHQIATTQLCATDARRMFPCFDEPAFKATFEVAVVVPPHLAAWSNSPVASETVLGDGRREVRFAPTMRMSSYLVALVVGPFERSEPVDVDGVPLSVVCTPGKSHLAAFALEVGAFALRFYADYFGIAYPGDKVDLVGIPDFAYGAMENLGCVTFRETLLLVDPATASTTELQDVAMVVAHELAHMWFGDLVTMAWWEGIWLNEAFATFLQYTCAGAFRPEWQLWIRFNAEREIGLTIDGLHSTRPIEFPVHSPADAMVMFDPITYQKGGSVLRMLEQYLGAEVYRDGIRRYLADHAYANTVTADLWAALEAVSGEPVGAIMDTWILQGGHPVVALHDGSLTQSPFEFRPAEGASAIGSSWQVPVLSRPLHGGPPVAQRLGDAALALGVAEPAVVNAGGAGMYRTNYDAGALAVLTAELGALGELERAVVLGDAWALARAGVRTVGEVLALARGLGPVVEPSSWSIVDDVLGTLDRLVGDADRAALESTASALFAPVLDRLGWEAADGEDQRSPLVRATAVRVLGCVGRDPAVRAEAAARFDSGVVEGDLARSIVTVVAAMNRAGDAGELLRRCREAKDPQAEERYRAGVAALADRDHAVATFEHCFELFRAQDAPRVIVQLMLNPSGGPAVWEALAASWDATLAKIPPQLMFAVAMGITSFISDRDVAERVAAFHRAHPLEVGQQRVAQSVERMLNGVAFAERARPDLAAALR